MVRIHDRPLLCTRRLAAVGADAELDAETKATVLELARDETFLLACEDYMRATSFLH